MDRWCIIDTFTNQVLNVIVWDGVTEYSPPEGTYLRPAKEPVEVGWVYNSNTDTYSAD